MNAVLTEAQQRKILLLLTRIDSACRGSLKTSNHVRMIRLEITKSQRRAKRSAAAQQKTQTQSIKIAES